MFFIIYEVPFVQILTNSLNNKEKTEVRGNFPDTSAKKLTTMYDQTTIYDRKA